MSQKLIKAAPLQKDPQFIKWINRGQLNYKWFIKKAKMDTNWSDIEIVSRYITMCDVIIGLFKDSEYELGWGFYVIKGQRSLTLVIDTG
jgi:hypothetical protein